MFRQISIGATAVLTAGMIAVGCGSDGDTIISGSSGDTANTDPTGFVFAGPGTGLAPDGGGVSPDGTDVVKFRAIYNENLGSSDGASAGDCSAVVLFTTDDNRTFVTHYNASTITPPVELEAVDHDANSSFFIDSAVVSFLQLSGYENSVATADVQNAIRQNDRMIIVAMAGNTSLQDPTLNITKTGGANRGVHTGLWTWLFNPAFRGLEQTTASTTNPVGSVTAATSPYYNGVTSSFRFGWQNNAGAEVALNVGGTLVPAVTGGIDPVTPGTQGLLDNTDSPRSDVLSFGLVTDGNQRQQSYEGPSTSSFTNNFGGRSQTFANLGATAALAPSGNSISPGEAVSVLALVYTQVVTSLDQGTTNTNLFFGGSTIAAFASPFNLNTLQFETIQRINPPTSSTNRNVAYDPDFNSYNNLVLFRYREDTPSSDVVGFDPYAPEGSETILHKAAFRQTATGSAALGSSQDLATRVTTAGLHRQYDLAIPTPTAALNQEQETQEYLDDRGVYGRDEGLAETVIFFTTSDATFSGGQEDTGSGVGNTDTAIYCALLTQGDYTTNGGTGSTDGDLVTGTTNPLLVSRHDSDDITTTIPFSDAVEAVETQINRTGDYVHVAYVQREGSQTGGVSTAGSITRRRTLKDVVYQAVRFGATPVALPSRLSTPFEVSDPTLGAGTTTTFNNGRVSQDAEPNLPVNAYAFEGGIDYRCGNQSNSNVMWALWEQSDGTEDRLFVRALAVTLGTPPTISSTNVTVEIDELTTEQTVSDAADTVPATVGNERSQFNFLNNGIANGNGSAVVNAASTSDTTVGAADNASVGLLRVQSCDLGTAGAQTGASIGGLFLSYVKVTDNTRPAVLIFGPGVTAADGDGFDAAVFANAVLVGAAADLGRVAIDNNFNEDDLSIAVGNLSTGSDIFQVIPAGGQTTDTVTTVNTQPNLIYVFFTEPTQSNTSDSTSDGFFCRTFDAAGLFRAGTSTGLAADFQQSFFPSAASATFAAPNRLDHTTGGDVESLIGSASAGNQVAVIFREDEHDWLNGSSDGRTFFSQGGATNPFLMDKERTQNIEGKSTITTCENGSCDDANVIYMFSKRDQGFNRRLSLGSRAFP
jgi:hypothetical protein